MLSSKEVHIPQSMDEEYDMFLTLTSVIEPVTRKLERRVLKLFLTYLES